MHLLRLRAEQLRLFEAVDFEPTPGVNLLLGPNGAGKTSLLEAVYLLGYGRSFRAGAREAVVRRGAESLQVFAEIADARGERHRLGLQRSGRQWQARIDGRDVGNLSELFVHCPVVCFEPGSHELIAGPAELRRRYLDWGLFHVEQTFLDTWRDYQRALRQRNALLRGHASTDEFLPWEHELGSLGERLHQMRGSYVAALAAPLVAVAAEVFPSPGPPTLRYLPGWSAEGEGLATVLAASRDRDRQVGYTTAGPHRANWSLHYPDLPTRDALSRGQEKLSALCCILAQAQHFAAVRGDWPIMCIDDLGSELDRPHQARAADWLAAQPAQVWVTGTDAPAGFAAARDGVTTFHVEQGTLRRLL
jgi:DNA replication and repair protein RecF